MVYFVQAETGGPIKIGWTEDADASARLVGLQIGNPYRLVIRSTMLGGHADEKELHRRFRLYRLNGEWFAPCRELVRLADALGDPDDSYAYEAAIVAAHRAGFDSATVKRKTNSVVPQT